MNLFNEKSIKEAISDGKSLEDMSKELTEKLKTVFEEQQKEVKKEEHIKEARHRAAVALYSYLKISDQIEKDIKIADIEEILKNFTISTHNQLLDKRLFNDWCSLFSF